MQGFQAIAKKARTAAKAVPSLRIKRLADPVLLGSPSLLASLAEAFAGLATGRLAEGALVMVAIPEVLEEGMEALGDGALPSPDDETGSSPSAGGASGVGLGGEGASGAGVGAGVSEAGGASSS